MTAASTLLYALGGLELFKRHPCLRLVESTEEGLTFLLFKGDFSHRFRLTLEQCPRAHAAPLVALECLRGGVVIFVQRGIIQADAKEALHVAVDMLDGVQRVPDIHRASSKTTL